MYWEVESFLYPKYEDGIFILSKRFQGPEGSLEVPLSVYNFDQSISRVSSWWMHISLCLFACLCNSCVQHSPARKVKLFASNVAEVLARRLESMPIVENISVFENKQQEKFVLCSLLTFCNRCKSKTFPLCYTNESTIPAQKWSLNFIGYGNFFLWERKTLWVYKTRRKPMIFLSVFFF